MKNNKLIAEFMGLEFRNGDFFIPKTSRGYIGGDWLFPSELQYHTSWDWLMPVVQKIEDGLDPHGIIDNALGSREIEGVYDACVTLIKAYNNE